MNYELAKKLKDAGFPQDLDEYLYASNGDYVGIKSGREGYNEEKELVHYDDGFWRGGDAIISIPTLSELIEACGYGFRQLTLHTEYNTKRESIGRVWMAKAGKKSGGFLKSGHSPEEVVTNLWLQLQTNKE